MPEQAPIADDPSKRPAMTGEELVNYLNSLEGTAPSPKEVKVFSEIIEGEKPGTHDGEVLK